MNAPTKIICSNCGYATNDDVGEDGVTTRVGRCCEGLPRPYEWDSASGTYSALVDRAITIRNDYGGHTEDDDCDCPDCVNDAIGLGSEDYDRITALYEREDPSYNTEITALGW